MIVMSCLGLVDKIRFGYVSKAIRISCVDGYGCLDGLIMIFMCMFCSFMLCYYLMRLSENDSHASVVCFVVFLLFY